VVNPQTKYDGCRGIMLSQPSVTQLIGKKKIYKCMGSIIMKCQPQLNFNREQFKIES
jgi:hypothetical protein